MELNDGWQLRCEDLAQGPEDAAWVAAREGDWLEASLPCDIHVPLIAAGLIKDPVLADYSYDCEWTEKKSWWFRRDFELGAEDLAACERAELVLEGIDGLGFVFVNGRLLGRHESAHFPFTADAKSLLGPGKNQILVRVSSGVEGISEAELAPFRQNISVEYEQGRGDRGDKRRALVRKPQYVFGWDWGPRVVTCGLTGRARLELVALAVTRRVSVRTLRIEKDLSRATLGIDVEIDQLHDFSTREALVLIEIRRRASPGEAAAVAAPSVAAGIGEGGILASEKRELLLRSGINHLDLQLEVPSPELWWPNGYGSQPLYEAWASVLVEGVAIPRLRQVFGIRTIELDLGKLPEGGRSFSFVVNGLPLFCKGADWIPADSIYARVSDEKYSRLIDEARAANFTMLRIWGGGIYEPEVFYRLCDEAGILVWQDFMYACACYPDRDEAFYRLAEREAEHQITRLRNHPCLAIWCGNNESSWGFDEWWSSDALRPAYFGGARIYNELLPEMVRVHSPAIPYWNSSPYGGAHPNANEVGDRHHWFDCMMNPVMEKRISPEEFDAVESRFVSEYGYPGPCVRETIEEYHDGRSLDLEARVWKLHNNTFEKDTVRAGIAKHYRDPEGMDLEEYLRYASACQSLMLGYSLESLRSKTLCSGALFWMYDDCWGEVGWTIIDYYLRRKPSWYAVRRALSPRRLILRRKAGTPGTCSLILCNETAQAFEGEIEYGWLSYDGSTRVSKATNASLAPAQRRELLHFEASGRDETEGCFFAAPLAPESSGLGAGTEGLEPATLRPGLARAFMNIQAEPRIGGLARRADGDLEFLVSSARFAHGVHFNLGPALRPGDEYFDLLPGETRRIVVSGGQPGAELPAVSARALNGGR